MVFFNHMLNVFGCMKKDTVEFIWRNMSEFGEKVEGLEGVGVKIIKFLEKMTSTLSGVPHKHILNLKE